MADVGAIVVGGFVNGLGLVRSLGARAVPVTVVSTQPYDVAHRSRWCTELVRLHGIDERPELLLDVLRARARSHRGWVVIPSTDDAVAALAPHHDELASSFRLAAPAPGAARVLLDKHAMTEAARALGIACPVAYGAAEPAVVERDDLRFPVVVKPRAGYRFGARFGRKLFFATSRDELRAAVADVAAAAIEADVAAFVDGADADIYAHATYLDARSEPIAGVTIRKLRQSPARFGVARVAEIVADPADQVGARAIAALRDATIALARRIGLRGIAVAEFKRDARDGVFRFIEINGRSVIYNALLRRAGLDLAALAWSDAVDGAPLRPTITPWPGVWIHLHADVLHAFVHGRSEGLGVRDFVAPYRRPKVYGVWSVADPMPFWSEWGRTAWVALTTARNFRPVS